MMEEIFVRGCKDCPDSAEILNWYRNLYYKEPDSTERGITALAINDILPDYVHQEEQIALLTAENEVLRSRLENVKAEAIKEFRSSLNFQMKPIKGCKFRNVHSKTGGKDSEALDRLIYVITKCCDELYDVTDRCTVGEFANKLLANNVTVRRRR